MHVWEGEGSGFDVVGSAVGLPVSAGRVVAGPCVGVTGEAPAVADRVALPPALLDAEGDGESEADADAEGFGDIEPVPVLVGPSRDRAGRAVLCACDDVPPSAFAPPAAGGPGSAKGASTPSSARLRPPAARTKPAVIRRVRRRRRRWAAALRSRRLVLPPTAGPVACSSASRPVPRRRPSARRLAARPCGTLPSSGPCMCWSGLPESSSPYGSAAMSDCGATSASSACARSSSTAVPHPGHARAPLRCRRHGWQKSMTRED